MAFEPNQELAAELKAELEKHGFDLSVYIDARLGIQSARQSRPDLIILSVELPNTNGWLVCNKLKRDAKIRNIPVVLVSNEATDEVFEQHKKMKTRAQGYLRKPYAPREMVDLVHTLVKPLERPSYVARHVKVSRMGNHDDVVVDMEDTPLDDAESGEIELALDSLDSLNAPLMDIDDINVIPCSRCGRPFSDTDSFCTTCGSPRPKPSLEVIVPSAPEPPFQRMSPAPSPPPAEFSKDSVVETLESLADLSDDELHQPLKQRRDKALSDTVPELSAEVVLPSEEADLSEQLRTQSLLGGTFGCLIVLHGDSASNIAIVGHQGITIGREWDRDLMLDDENVSRRHCEVTPSADRKEVILRDMGSANGTFVNSFMITEHRLEEGDLIQLGSSLLKFLSGDSVEHLYYRHVDQKLSKDAVTNLANSRHFRQELVREAHRARRFGRRLSLVLMHIDDYAGIRDVIWPLPAMQQMINAAGEDARPPDQVSGVRGRIVVDEVALKIASLLRALMEEENTDHLLGRWDEFFALLLPEATSMRVKRIAETIRRAVEAQDFTFGDLNVPVTLSCAISTRSGEVLAEDALGDDAQDQEESGRSALSLCQEALERTAVTGGNRVTCVEDEDAECEEPDLSGSGPTVCNTIPLRWFKILIGQTLRGGENTIEIGISALRAPLAVLVDGHSEELILCERELVKALCRQGIRVISDARDGVYLYFRVCHVEGALASVQPVVAREYRDAMTRLSSLSETPLNLVHGCAGPFGADTSLDFMIDEAFSSLDLRATRDTERRIFPIPFPIAYSLARIDSCATKVDAFREGCLAAERALRFLGCVASAGLVWKCEDDPDREEELKYLAPKVRTRWSMSGEAMDYILGVARASRKAEWPVVSRLLEPLVNHRGRPTELAQLAGDLIDLRNEFEQGRLSDDVASAKLPDLLEKLRSFINGLEMLEEVRLATLSGLERSEAGDYICQIRDHIGTNPEFLLENIRRSEGLPPHTYLFVRGSEQTLRLSPFLILRSCGSCGLSELFWPSAWALEASASYESVTLGHILRETLSEDRFIRLPSMLKRR